MKLFNNSYLGNLRYRFENRAFLGKIKKDRRNIEQAFKQDSINIPFYSSIDIELPKLDLSGPSQWFQKHLIKLLIACASVVAIYGIVTVIPSLTQSEVTEITKPSPEVATVKPVQTTPTTVAIQQKPITKKTSEDKAEPIATVPLPQYAVLVIKSTKALHIVKQTNHKWDIVQSLSIATGEFEGDKRVEGDKKTPEGDYFIKDIKTGESQGSLYGALVFKLNYPNETDVKAKKTGGGIWIHGVEFGLTPVYTKGCVALSNKDVIKLTPYLTVGTPVTILSAPPKRKLEEIFSVARLSKEYPEIHEKFVKPAPPQSELQSIFSKALAFSKREASYLANEKIESTSQETYDYFRKFVSGWKSAWESRNADKYSNFYHPGFIDRSNRKKDAFIHRKGLIFSSKDSISVKIEKIQVFHKADSLIQVTFVQDYTAYNRDVPQKFGKRTKHLYLKKHNDNWLINTEK